MEKDRRVEGGGKVSKIRRGSLPKTSKGVPGKEPGYEGGNIGESSRLRVCLVASDGCHGIPLDTSFPVYTWRIKEGYRLRGLSV